MNTGLGCHNECRYRKKRFNFKKFVSLQEAFFTKGQLLVLRIVVGLRRGAWKIRVKVASLH